MEEENQDDDPGTDINEFTVFRVAPECTYALPNIECRRLIQYGHRVSFRGRGVGSSVCEKRRGSLSDVYDLLALTVFNDGLAAIERRGGFKIARHVLARRAQRVLGFQKLLEVFAFYVMAPAKAGDTNVEAHFRHSC